MPADVEIIFPDRPLGDQNAIVTIAELRALDSTDVNDNTNILVASTGFFKYDPSSLAADDGATVIKPTDKTSLQAGRWLIVLQASAATTSFTQAGTGAVTRSAQAKMRDTVSVKDFGALGDDTADDTAAIQAADNALKAAGGGDLYFPKGLYRTTALTRTYAAKTPITWKGDGKFNSVLKKIAGTTTPILSVDGALTTDGCYGGFEDIGFLGNAKGGAGLRLTDCFRLHLTRVECNICDVGLDLVGSLEMQINDLTTNGNNIGTRLRKSAAHYCNNISFYGGEARANTSFAFDIGDASGGAIHDLDMEANGTAGDANTGGLIFRSTMDDETGYANWLLVNLWAEANVGTTLRAEACAGLNLTQINTKIIDSESNRDMNIGAIMNSTIIGPVCPNGTLTIAAAGLSTIQGGFVETVTDTSGSQAIDIVDSGGFTSIRKSAGGPNWNDATCGFYTTTPIAKQTGVAVTAGGIHAALVALGLIAA